MESPITEQTLTDEIEAVETDGNTSHGIDQNISEHDPSANSAVTQTLDPNPDHLEADFSNATLVLDPSLQGPSTSTDNESRDRKRKISVFLHESSGTFEAKKIVLSSQMNVGVLDV